jgi:hypothetical protein
MTWDMTPINVLERLKTGQKAHELDRRSRVTQLLAYLAHRHPSLTTDLIDNIYDLSALHQVLSFKQEH